MTPVATLASRDRNKQPTATPAVIPPHPSENEGAAVSEAVVGEAGAGEAAVGEAIIGVGGVGIGAVVMEAHVSIQDTPFTTLKLHTVTLYMTPSTIPGTSLLLQPVQVTGLEQFVPSTRQTVTVYHKPDSDGVQVALWRVSMMLLGATGGPATSIQRGTLLMMVPDG